MALQIRTRTERGSLFGRQEAWWLAAALLASIVGFVFVGGLTAYFNNSPFQFGESGAWPGVAALQGSCNYNCICEEGEDLGCFDCQDGEANFYCGDGVCCPSIEEDQQTCPSDCKPYSTEEPPPPTKEPPSHCGNGICEEGEGRWNCPEDCPAGAPGGGSACRRRRARNVARADWQARSP